MNTMNDALKIHFKGYEKKYDFFKLSTSEEHGEGEHKLVEHVRTEPEWHQNKETLIYGLDSDLIVLGLHHLKYGNIKLLRESPAFMISTMDEREATSPNVFWIAFQKGRMSIFIESAFGYR